MFFYYITYVVRGRSKPISSIFSLKLKYEYACIFGIKSAIGTEVVFVVTENIPQIILRNAAMLTVLGRIKIRVRSDFVSSTAMETDRNLGSNIRNLGA